MPSATTARSRPDETVDNESDRRFNYDDDVEEFFRDLPVDNDAQNGGTTAQEPRKDIDEEVVVKRKRRPNPKLDQERLISLDGIPRLRRITKTRLKFRGKGHEFSDISRLLNTYQLWLDDLYPKAKFRDALAMVEKLGHSKRLQVTRRGWLDATKPHQKEDAGDAEGVEYAMVSGGLGEQSEGPESREGDDRTTVPKSLNSASRPDDDGVTGNNTPAGDAPDDDELDALMAEAETTPLVTTADSAPQAKGPFEEEELEDDELDALLAAETVHGTQKAAAALPNNQSASNHASASTNDFADEEEIMAEMGDEW